MPRVTFVQIDRSDWEIALRGAIQAAAHRHLGAGSAIEFSTDWHGADLALYLGSVKAAADPAIDTMAREILRQGCRVVPIVGDLRNFRSETPPSLHPINGMSWTNVAVIAEEVVRHLGLTERDRRLFLSYLRREATPLAHQLYDELHRRRYSVFLDSFEVDHGDWVQDRIEQALHETSFVLLLYSPSVETSEWVEKEISFALSEGLGLVALAWPGAAERPPFRMAPSDRRVQLSKADITAGGTLRSAALARVCLEIEREHADQFRARRERLLQDIAEALGPQTVRVGSHSLRYVGVNTDALVRVSPRAPDARDVYLLDQDCPETVGGASKPLNRVLVGVKGGYAEGRTLTQWVCGALRHEIDWYEPQAICADPSLLEH